MKPAIGFWQMALSLRIFLLLALAPVAAPGAASGRAGTLVKHTVSGSGSFEQSRGVRAEVNRATFHPIDHHFSLSVYGRMGWVITGQWTREGDEVLLKVANMNNNPARGSGELKLDSRGNVESVNLSGSGRGGAYRVRFKAAPQTASAPPTVRMGPGPDDAPPKAPVLKPFDATGGFDRSRRGQGLLRMAGSAPITILSAELQTLGAGRVSIRATSPGNTFRFEGTASSSPSRDELDLVLHGSGGASGVVTGTALMDRSGRTLEDLDLRGWMDGRTFVLDFQARH